MFCKNCGQQVKIGSKFCKNCGNEIKIGRISILKNRITEWFKDHWKGLTIIVVIIVILALFGSNNNSSTGSPTNQPPKQPVSNNAYDQSQVASSVVNIFCPSTVPNEESIGGSGTIISDDGLILTNSHIIPQEKNYIHVDEVGCLVILPNPTTGQAEASYLAHPIVIPDISTKYDLTFMSIYAAYYDQDKKEYAGIYPRKFPAFKETTTCDNTNPQLGQSVRIFGYPAISGGYSLTITDGIISSFSGDGLIYTSAEVSHGNSGGLAVDQNGCMIGIPSMVSSDENASLGIIISTQLVGKFSNEVEAYINKNPVK